MCPLDVSQYSRMNGDEEGGGDALCPMGNRVPNDCRLSQLHSWNIQVELSLHFLYKLFFIGFFLKYMSILLL